MTVYNGTKRVWHYAKGLDVSTVLGAVEMKGDLRELAELMAEADEWLAERAAAVQLNGGTMLNTRVTLRPSSRTVEAQLDWEEASDGL